MNIGGVETERKFLIEMPPRELLVSLGGDSIVQTYIENKDGVSERVRKRNHLGKTTYTHTKKRRISSVEAFEDEEEIGREEYARLEALREAGTRPIIKTRYVMPYRGYDFEIDVYPEWEHIAVMEVEMESADASPELPPIISVIREVSGERRFSNHSLSREFPDEASAAEKPHKL